MPDSKLLIMKVHYLFQGLRAILKHLVFVTNIILIRSILTPLNKFALVCD